VDVEKAAAGVLGLDLLLDPPVGGKVRDICLVSRASAASEDSDDVAIPGEDDGPGIASIGKLAMFLVVGQDGNLDGGVLDVILRVVAGEGFETISTANSGPSGHAILHDEETLATISFKVLGVSDLLVCKAPTVLSTYCIYTVNTVYVCICIYIPFNAR